MKTGDEPARNPAEVREDFTVPDTGPVTAAAVGMTEPAATSFPGNSRGDFGVRGRARGRPWPKRSAPG